MREADKNNRRFSMIYVDITAADTAFRFRGIAPGNPKGGGKITLIH